MSYSSKMIQKHWLEKYLTVQKVQYKQIVILKKKLNFTANCSIFIENSWIQIVKSTENSDIRKQWW